jgi:hypothetical protein
MKYFLLSLGFLLIFISALNLFKYLSDYFIITDYGKGFIWGNILLLIIGILIFIWGLKKRKNKATS